MRNAARDEGLERAAQASPEVPWDRFRPRFEKAWKPGQHIAVFGPNGYGKTTFAIELGELATVPTIMLVTKRRDSLISELPARGWQLTRTLEQTKHAVDNRQAGERYFGRTTGTTPPRILFWPTATGGLQQRRAKLRSVVEKLLDWVYEHGSIVLIADEGIFLIRNLRQGENIEMLLHEARSSRVSLVLLGQRPAWFPRSVYSAATYLGMFATNDPDDLKRLSEIGGSIDPRPLREDVQLLPMYEFVLVSPRSKPAWSIRTSIPPQKPRRVKQPQ